MPFKVETCLRNKKFFMIVVNVKMVLSLLENINLAPKIAFRYVDDIRKLLRAIKLGWRWENRKMRNKQAWEREEKKINMTCTQKTTTELKKT